MHVNNQCHRQSRPSCLLNACAAGISLGRRCEIVSLCRLAASRLPTLARIWCPKRHVATHHNNRRCFNVASEFGNNETHPVLAFQYSANPTHLRSTHPASRTAEISIGRWCRIVCFVAATRAAGLATRHVSSAYKTTNGSRAASTYTFVPATSV